MKDCLHCEEFKKFYNLENISVNVIENLIIHHLHELEKKINKIKR